MSSVAEGIKSLRSCVVGQIVKINGKKFKVARTFENKNGLDLEGMRGAKVTAYANVNAPDTLWFVTSAKTSYLNERIQTVEV